MLTKWEKYYEEPDQIHIIAHILDPQFKLRFLREKYDTSIIQSKFVTMIKNAYNYYCANNVEKVTQVSSTSQSQSSTLIPQYTTVAGINRSNSLFKSSKSFLEDEFQDPSSNSDCLYQELESYLNSDTEKYKKLNMTLLEWWRINALSRFPTLSRFAASILAVPATSVPSECTFSRSGRLLTPHRGRLNPKTVKGLYNKVIILFILLFY